MSVRSGRHRRKRAALPRLGLRVAPPYPNAVVGILINTQLYQFQAPQNVVSKHHP
jgi:hypothetical protein